MGTERRGKGANAPDLEPLAAPDVSGAACLEACSLITYATARQCASHARPGSGPGIEHRTVPVNGCKGAIRHGRKTTLSRPHLPSRHWLHCGRSNRPRNQSRDIANQRICQPYLRASIRSAKQIDIATHGNQVVDQPIPSPSTSMLEPTNAAEA